MLILKYRSDASALIENNIGSFPWLFRKLGLRTEFWTVAQNILKLLEL